ncbi:hypothetical protein L3Q82_013345 [Scortum barcoo]|uniref:Uncharacterized protein n=1 Tax=Scortum barcoo TaxID=214431 RepID=A0ACB8W0B1_9TELE|nr:hypothetical protein L3Q82_013345 [Scortum barcoo]
MFHLNVRHLLPQQRVCSLTDIAFNAEMGWNFCIIWFLYVSMSQCWHLPDSEPPMHGEVQSPQYPLPYPPNLQQQWDLSVPEGYQIRLTFTHLDIEASPSCHYDALTVLYNDKILGKFCGHENSADGNHPGNQPLLSPGNRLTLILQTDDNNPERRQNVGFSAQYQAIGNLSIFLSCGGGIFDEPEGHLFSPGYPNAPPHAVSCQYIIAVESGFTVSLNFTDNFQVESVDTQQGTYCPHHWLQVTIPGTEPMKLCGRKSPGLIVTNSNTVTLDYHTDNDGMSNGWSLDYSTHRVKCPFPGNIAKGRVTPLLTEYLYRDYIFVRCDQGYKIMMDGQEVESFSTMCQSNGQWHLPLPECHIIDCGDPRPLLNGGVTFLSGFQNQYLSVVQYHCNEPFYSLLGGVNVTFTCEADRKWRSNNDIVVTPTCIPVCGRPTKLIPIYQRIIGGSQAPDKTIPWQVLLSVDGNRGGGMVIADRWIMTAAHVLQQKGILASNDSVRIYMGLTNVKTQAHSPVYAASFHVHPEYHNADYLNYNNDIALIKLLDPITFDSSVMPICLPAEGTTYVTGMMGLVTDALWQMHVNFCVYPLYTFIPAFFCQDKQILEVKFQCKILQTTAYVTSWSMFLCLSVRESWQLPDSEPVLHGEIQSPQYPWPYSPNLLKKWDLWVPEGYKIQLNLTHLDIKASSGCRQDSLTVHYDQKILGKFCGQKNSTDHLREKSVLSKSNKLTLVFQTSNSTPELQQHIGFSATYEAIDMDECSKLDPGNDTGPLCSQICINTPGSYHCSCYYGYQLHSDQRTCLISCGGHVHDKHKGHLSSPRFPRPSPPFLSCKYIISVEPTFIVTLNFTDNFHIESVDTEHGPSCLHHWLQVTIPDKTPMRLCGGKSPGLIATNSNTVTLDYHTDSKGLSHGWSLDYSTNGKRQRKQFYNFVENCGDPAPLPNGGVTFLSGFQNQFRSVVQYYCNEPFYSLPEGKNVSFTCEANRKWRSKHSDITPTCIPVCGKPTKLISAYQRIIGGREAPDNTIPWQVLLSVHRIRGGGMVIADRWILTAAHDLTHNGKLASVEAVQIYMGFTDVKTLLRSRVYAASIHIHPEYNNPNDLDFNNDIALIKLRDPITFNSSIMPICLPAEDARYITDMMGETTSRESWQLPDSESVIHGEIQSPQYPRPYPSNLLKQWDIWVPEGYQIQLSLTHLDIKASLGCNQDSLTHEGHLSSPGYPHPSPPSLSCKYIISVDPTFIVTLNFTDNFHIESVDTEHSLGCPHNWLQVTIPDKTPMRLCGGKSPGLIVTNSSLVRLDYHTDNKGLSRGWSLDYSTHSEEQSQCPFPGNVTKGTVTPVLTEYFYRNYIYVTCDKGYKLMMDGQKIKTFSSMCQSNGQWHLPLPKCQIITCGAPKPLLNGGVTFLSGFQNQYLSVVKYHCNEPFYSLPEGVNVTLTCEADRKWRSSHNDVAPTCIPVCGQPTKLIPIYQRIIGGSQAPDKTIPWQVLLSVDGNRAGGMVIADRWIMTAAQILQQKGILASNDSVRIYMGLTNVKTQAHSPVYAASFHVHPEYHNADYLNYNNDIALIKLHDPITFDSSVMPICLPAEGATYVTGMMGLVSGFGVVQVDNKRFLTTELNYVQLPVVEQETCSNSITAVKMSRDDVPNLTNNMFCAGVPEGGKDSCQGDSGGPFALWDGGQFWAAGIVSWGVDCGQQGSYGIYTRVDESRFTLSTCDRRDRVWRRRGERSAACNILQHDRFGSGSVMVWGGISLGGRTALHVLARGSLTAIRYRDEILRPLFLQDEGIDAMDWPVRSPDLNPIEHIWDIMSRSIHQRHVAPQTVQELADALVQVWEEIPQEKIRHLIRSMQAPRESWQLPDSESVIHGEIQSPQYPRPYPSNLLKQWDLWVPEGYQIQLSLTHLDIKASLGCNQDSLTVLCDQKVLGKFCGQENSTDHPGKEPIFSQGNRLTLIFQTRASANEPQKHIGFSAIHKAIDMDECSKPDPRDGSSSLCSQICINTPGSYRCSCHYGYELHSDQHTCLTSCGGCVFDKHEGHLSSPWYPHPSPPFLSCKYIISVDPTFIVTLNFMDNFHIESMDTEHGPRCLKHWLQVTIPGGRPVKLCGGKSPGLIATNSSTVTLDYHTDSEGLSRGWRLDYSTHRVICPFPGNVTKGRVTPVLTEYFYRDYIYVTCDQGYKLMMDGREIKTFSAMCQINNQWHLPLPECHIIDCGEPKPVLNGGWAFLSGFKYLYRSVVQYHCNEPFYSLPGGVNANFTCDVDSKWRSNQTDVTPTCIPVCGQPTKLISAYQRTIGGSDGPDNAIPWHVLLNIDGRIGGGMVIADQWIITAAHDLTHDGKPASTETLQIYMGLTDAKSLTGSRFYAASIHIHPGYKNPKGLDYNNDIALIKLQDPIIFNSSVMPICLPPENATYVTGTIGLVSGFTVTDTDNRRILTEKLQYVHLLLVEQETCHNSINKLKVTSDSLPSLTNNMFCAGVPGGGLDSCHGDSGSPITLRDYGQFWAAGVVSWGVECRQQGTYGIYTKVANYVDWIKNTMQEN